MATDKRIFYSMLRNLVFDTLERVCYNYTNCIVVHRKFGAFGRPHYKGRLAKSLAHGLTQLTRRVTPEGIGVDGHGLHWVQGLYFNLPNDVFPSFGLGNQQRSLTLNNVWSLTTEKGGAFGPYWTEGSKLGHQA